MIRRFGEVDAVPINILKATAGAPPKQRPLEELSASVLYIFRHMDFDHRKLEKTLKKRFNISRCFGNPFPLLPTFFNFELYYICSTKS